MPSRAIVKWTHLVGAKWVHRKSYHVIVSISLSMGEVLMTMMAALAQQESESFSENVLTDGKRRIYSARYALSSLVVCGNYRDIYRRIKWNNRGKKSTVWRCVSRVEKKKSGIDCSARTIREEDLHAAVVTAINDAWARRDKVTPALKENLQTVLMGLRMPSLQKSMRKSGKSRLNLKIGGDDLTSFPDEQTEAITEYSKTLVRQLIEKMPVYDEKLTVEFESGLEIDADV